MAAAVLVRPLLGRTCLHGWGWGQLRAAAPAWQLARLLVGRGSGGPPLHLLLQRPGLKMQEPLNAEGSSTAFTEPLNYRRIKSFVQ
jgi:hypothetical protein